MKGVAYRWTSSLDFVVANQVALPSTFTATDIWMAPSGVMYAIGLGGNAETLYRLSGGTWSPVALPTSRTLLGVWGSSESDVIVVGDSGTVLRYDGSSWSQVNGAPTATISDVWSPGDGNYYFATSLGAYGLLNGTFRQLHGFSIFRVRGSGPNDVVFNANVRWDGQRATLIGTSLVLGNFGFGFSSFAASANEIAVTSLNGIVAVQPRVGAARAIVLAINPKFTDVDVTSETHAVAVGDWGQVARFNGTTWTSEATPDYVHLGFVSSLGPTQTWATGSTGIYFSNGTGWTEVHRRAAGNFELWGIWANSASDVWAVGRNGLVMRFDGAAWRSIPSGTTTYLRTVWGTGPSNMFVGGDNGVILRWNGTSFQGMNSGTTNSVQRIRGIGPTAAYAYASGGLYLRYDGTSWAPLTASASPAVDWSLWVNGPNDIYSSSSCVNRFDATSWSTVECNLPGLLGFDGLSTGGAVGAGVSGRLWLGRNAQARGFNVVAGTSTTTRIAGDQFNARVELAGSADGALPRVSKEPPRSYVTRTRR
jgi:hypothetical protein